MFYFNPEQNRMLDIFIPERSERIGCIDCDGDVHSNARIYVCGTPLQFTMKSKMEEDNPLTVVVRMRTLLKRRLFG